MRRLRWIIEVVLQRNPYEVYLFASLLKISLHWNHVEYELVNNSYVIREVNLIYADDGSVADKEIVGEVNEEEFDDICKIILYYNFPYYDDSPINPELKKAMDEEDEIRNKGYEFPNVERKMSMITAKSGLSRTEQKNMTYRAWQMTYDEVVNLVNFESVWPVAVEHNFTDKVDHWVRRKVHDKFEGRFTDKSTFNKSMGGDGNIQGTVVDNDGSGDALEELFNANYNRT